MLNPISPNNPLAKIFNAIPFIMQVILGLVIGILIALVYPYDKTVIPTFGTIFVSALKAMAPILVFVLVSSAIAGHTKGTKTNMTPVIVVYFVSMALASVRALIVSYIVPTTFPSLVNVTAGFTPTPGILEVHLTLIFLALYNQISTMLNVNSFSS